MAQGGDRGDRGDKYQAGMLPVPFFTELTWAEINPKELAAKLSIPLDHMYELLSSGNRPALGKFRLIFLADGTACFVPFRPDEHEEAKITPKTTPIYISAESTRENLTKTFDILRSILGDESANLSFSFPRFDVFREGGSCTIMLYPTKNIDICSDEELQNLAEILCMLQVNLEAHDVESGTYVDLETAAVQGSDTEHLKRQVLPSKYLSIDNDVQAGKLAQYFHQLHMETQSVLGTDKKGDFELLEQKSEEKTEYTRLEKLMHLLRKPKLQPSDPPPVPCSLKDDNANPQGAAPADNPANPPSIIRGKQNQ